MPTRVLLMISSMRGGGSERQTLLLLKHLDRTRFEPHLYLTDRAGDLLCHVPTDVPIHSFEDFKDPGGLYFPGRIHRQQAAHLRSILVDNQIETVYDRTFHMSFIAGPACQKVNVPRVSTIVSPPELALPMVEHRFVGMKRALLAKAYRASRSIVAVSKIAAMSAETYYKLPPGVIRVIPNPVDIESLRNSCEVKAPKAEDHVALVCVGRMTAEKGHADLIRAVALTQSTWPDSAPPLRLTMIGDGPLRENLETLARETVHQHAIDFVGIDSNPAQAIAAADGLVLPSIFEGMPNVVLEAMAIGTPVIATRAGGTVELQYNEPTILWAQPNDPKSLAEAILEFATHRGEADDRAIAASRYVTEFHSIDRALKHIESLLLG
ncbi:4-alpha-N-acetylgalactosaminyltransferase [Planctomycetes bacterium CA13]|uniref:4-alpha-N-acetylgalactosaminyltransferase n=1 Tax=Novipirellula herctigrandis TaxID=2527986 RepID=A0A5C5Z3T5_9BACT|nr:4-alpha-N-acetylgalactosaminyltransferase [Planctomycetes bacterium CA13]